jgi:hypothetical protein
MEKLQALDSQAQPCYKPTLKSLFDLPGMSLHLFCKDRDGILKCSVFSLIVRDRRRGGNGGGSTLHGRLSLKAGKTYLGEVTSAATVVADRRTGVLLQAVFMQLRAAATTAILHLFAPLLEDVLIGQSLEVEIDVVGIDVHRVWIAKTGGRARSRRRVVTGGARLALVVLQVSDLQIDRVAIGLEHGIIFCHNWEVQKPIDVLGIQGLLEMVKQILVGPAGLRGPGLKICYKLTKDALALLHPDDLVLCVGLGTDRLELQFERREEGVLVCKRHLAFCERFHVGSGPHSCVFDHEREGQRDHFVHIEQSGSICTLHLFALWIVKCKAIFVCIDPNMECTPK